MKEKLTAVPDPDALMWVLEVREWMWGGTRWKEESSADRSGMRVKKRYIRGQRRCYK